MLRILLLLLTVAATTLAGCDRQVPVREERARPVRTVVVEASRTSITLELPGEVRPRVETRYGFRVGGKIAERLVSVGDQVQPGDRIRLRLAQGSLGCRVEEKEDNHGEKEL